MPLDLFCFQYSYQTRKCTAMKILCKFLKINISFFLDLHKKLLSEDLFFQHFCQVSAEQKMRPYSHCFYGPEECCMLAEEVSRRRVVFDLRSLPVQTVGQCKD